MKKYYYPLVAGLMAMAVCACGGQKSSGESVELTGAGATFPLPFYNMTFEGYSATHADRVSYGGIGSGGGVRNLKDGIVDFAGSDAFLSDKEMTEMPAVVHIPTCMGAVVLAYNLPDVVKLNLSGEVIADIYAGKITDWNDARLQELNPDVKLPAKKIILAFRSDGSGTTFVFTDYLSKVSENWKNTYGAGKTVDFPVGQAAKGNPGVAGIIAQTPYSLGYIGSEYAFAQKIPCASVINAQGEAVLPDTKSISAAAGEIPQDTRCSITNADAPGAYPISCFTWLLIYKEQDYSSRSEAQAKATLELMKYILSDSIQQTTEAVHYAPLPKKAVELSLNNLKEVTYKGQPVLK
ncbi:phosphate ABC transporter substrate-binding protein PstS [Phocaeicola faecicola]|mgnify:CR=1 FL=1|jgi:phosphate transport system substrate-binding protein|uniref:phosphate ABC transporter substrate-binding protein PstS n=1 Tax=Phocaeicola faecicola TaxID=2739389 RepID=UPI0015B41A95|nr:phosphate ABC transporter substrate-binding protein PstS [Phocaeicola faecicola]MDD6909444.1 phosphate ABC transporter substrate-binding protein PstS [Bacteroidaceae bacterium]MDY4871010.1 phosphate ABC transporter substrate-binding protein PstS [Phocaeicola faecicola]